MDEDPPDGGAAAAVADATTFRISRLRVIEATVHFRSSLAPGGRVTLHLPDLELENFGAAPGAASTLKVVFALIFPILGGGTMAQEGSLLPSDVRTSFGKEVEGATTLLKGLGRARI